MEGLSWMAVEMVLAESLHAPQHLGDLLYEPDPEYTRIIEQISANICRFRPIRQGVSRAPVGPSARTCCCGMRRAARL